MTYNNTDYTSRSVYLSVKISGKDLSVIPPKYIQSFSIERYTQDENGSATFSLDLVAPVYTFDTSTADSFTFLLTKLLSASIVDSSSDAGVSVGLDIVYGWLNGETFGLDNATISKCDVSMNEAGDFARYTISGVVHQVLFNGNLKNFYSSSTYLNSKSITESNFDSLIRFPKDNNGVARNQLSYIIENIAKFLYGNDFNIVVDHNDMPVSEKYRSDIAASFSSSEIDKSCVTLFNYLNKLISACYCIDADAKLEGNISALMPNGDSFVPVIRVNGQWYKITERESNSGYKYTYDPNGTMESNHPLSDMDLMASSTSWESVLYVTANDTAQGETEKSYYAFDPISNVDKSSLYYLDPGGTPLSCFDKYISRSQSGGKYTLRITASPPTSEKAVFTVSNNANSKLGGGDVVSFSLGVDVLPAIKAMTAVSDGKNNTTTVEAQSGLSIVSTTDLGGLSASDAAEASTLQKQYLSKLLSSIRDITSATLTVFATSKSCRIDMIDLIRVVPTINNGNTYFVGDYTIFKVTDSVDSSGFKTTFELRLHETEINEALQKELAEQTTSPGAEGSSYTESQVVEEPEDEVPIYVAPPEVTFSDAAATTWEWVKDNAWDLLGDFVTNFATTINGGH